jgi:hypothetical protein
MHLGGVAVIYYIILGGLMGYVFIRFIAKDTDNDSVIIGVIIGMMFGPIIVGIVFLFTPVFLAIKALDVFFDTLKGGHKLKNLFPRFKNYVKEELNDFS